MSVSIGSLPLWLSFALVVVVPTILSVFCAMLTRRVFGLDRLKMNNEVAGFKFAVVGVIYAVLLGFAVIVVWEKFRDAESAVDQEASDVVTIGRLSEGLDSPVRVSVRQALASYTQKAVDDDWPAMARGQISAPVSRALDSLYDAVLSDAPATPRDTAVMSELLTRLDSLTQARRTRLLLATGSVPSVLWTVLYGGAFVTLAFTFFFGVHSLRAQIVMNALLAALIFMALYVAVEIDHPFSGPTSVGPDSLRAALGMGKGSA
jgi:hypothetical protein